MTDTDSKSTDELAAQARIALRRLEENIGHALGVQSAQDVQTVRECLEAIEGPGE